MVTTALAVHEDDFNSPTGNFPPGFKQSEIGLIPVGWNTARLGDVLEFQNGVNADARDYGSGIPFANVLEVLTHSHLKEAQIPGRVRLPPAKIRDYQVRKGDILFNRTSETQEELALVSVYIDDADVVFGGFVIRGRPKDADFDSYYCGYAWRHEIVRRQIIARGQGAVRANIGQSDLRTVIVPKPPLPEQQAIAEALSDADTLIDALESLISKKRAIKQGAMQELLTGKRRLPGFKNAWSEKEIWEVADVDSDSLGAATNPSYVFQYISLEDVERGVLKSTTEVAFGSAPSRARRRVRKDDVLFGTVRPNLQSHCIIAEEVKDYVCSTGFAVIRCRPAQAVPRFVLAALFGAEIQTQIERLIAGSNYPAVNSGDVKKLRIFMPDPEEQGAIASALTDMDDQTTALQQKLAKARQIKQGMMQELLTGRVRLV